MQQLSRTEARTVAIGAGLRASRQGDRGERLISKGCSLTWSVTVQLQQEGHLTSLPVLPKAGNKSLPQVLMINTA